MIVTYQLKYFETPDGKLLARAKKTGDVIVPFGCYYDPAERENQFRLKLNEDLYPILHLLETAISRQFKVGPESIQYTAWINSKASRIVSIEGIKNLCERYLDVNGADQFNLYINIECIKELTSFGAQLNICVDSITWQNEEVTEDYPVWTISIADVNGTIDDYYSKKELTTIIQNTVEVMNESHSFLRNQIAE